MRFALCEVVDHGRRRYLDDLWPHVEASREPAATLPEREDPLPCLIVEDGGTRGLEGDPEQYEDTDGSGERNDFYYFWRNVGRSRKESADRGRWGLGKTVFAAASRLQAFFGLTVRSSDRRALLMGQAVLRIHRLRDARYRPYGYWGCHRDGFTMPVEDASVIREFERDFGLRRHDAPGLSIVIPFPDEEIDLDRLAGSILHHYFHPLLTGRLQVTVEGDGAAISLREDNLEREIRSRGLLDLLPVVELARWGRRPEREAVARLAPPPTGRAPRLTEDAFRTADLDRMRRRFDEGRRIALDVGVMIQRVGDEPRECRFRLLVERDLDNRRGEGYFVRQGITVDNAKAYRPRGVRWVLIADDALLSAFLGDAENPAHTEWQRSSPKFKEKYLLGPSTLDFVRSAPGVATSILSRPSVGRDPDLLREIFSLGSAAAARAPTAIEPSPPGGSESATIETPPGTFGDGGELVLARVRTGFRLRGRLGEGAPRRLEVIAAYDVLRGDPFRRYSPFDFRMDRTITIRADGVRVRSRKDNRLEIEIERRTFEMLVTRFDERRDLRVRIRPAEAQR